MTSVSWPTAEIVGIRRRGERSGDALVVERREVLGGAAAARDDQDVEAPPALQRADRLHDLGGGVLALDADRVDRDREAVEPAREDREDVADRRRPPATSRRRSRAGRRGIGRLRAVSKSPSASSFAFSCSKASCSAPAPTGSK